MFFSKLVTVFHKNKKKFRRKVQQKKKGRKKKIKKCKENKNKYVNKKISGYAFCKAYLRDMF